MPKRTDIKKILMIGSGPIIIGQAAEFDYAGTQACIALMEEGYEVVLVNSNPATIMTDKQIATKVYMEPLNVEFLTKIIDKERPDALLATMGGQIALNLALELTVNKVLEKYNVEILGTDYKSIQMAEDRELFKKLCEDLNEPVIESEIAMSIDEAVRHANSIGYPIIVRPAFTLGGTGGGFAYNDTELKAIAKNALSLSPVHQILIEKSIKGFKEIEYEVMRDHNDTAIAICNMENIDPVGVHTGDSMVVCPSQTLTNKEYQMLRNSALKIIRKLNIKGGCNVQFALDPNSMKYYLIEVNPRVSRSSALASKASGYPIARVSAKIACGYNLEEIKISSTIASFEPALDYIVTKIARFPFDKFTNANKELSTQMKATGEIMSIGRNFEESFLKGIRSLEINTYHILTDKFIKEDTLELLEKIKTPTDDRIFIIAELINRNVDLKEIYKNTMIDMFFLNKFQNIINIDKTLRSNLSLENIKYAKKNGFSDIYIASLLNMSEVDFYNFRKENKIIPVFKMIDTCASEFESYVPYFYSTYEEENESIRTNNKKIIVLGSGPIRIGQGIEFDYSTVHAIWAIKEMGYEAIIINNNPETVSTDYLISDKLYFEPLVIEDVMNIIDFEKPDGVIVELGGQTAINLASDLTKLNVNIIGTNFVGIENAENRDVFEKFLEKLDIKQPIGETVFTIEEGLEVANKIKYPVLVRPSYVLGGRAMQVVYNDTELTKYLDNAVKINNKQPILVDKYIEGLEIEVDAITDGIDYFVPGIMEHIEKTGVHSGDSISVFPSISLDDDTKKVILDYTKKLGINLGIIGLYNIQFIVDNNKEVYVIEVNPRSSRTVPFISKATDTKLANIATKVMLGMKLKDLGYVNYKEEFNKYFIKVPTFSFSKLRGLDIYLSPEMKSTGEAIGSDVLLKKALYKALVAAGFKVVTEGNILVTLSNKTKEEALPLIKRFYDLGFNIFTTKGTGNFLMEHGIKADIKKKLSEGSEEILDSLKKGEISYVINTVSTLTRKDGFLIRRVATENNINVFTSLDTAKVLIDVLEDIKQ